MDRCRIAHDAVDQLILAVKDEAGIEFEYHDRAHLQFVLRVDEHGRFRDPQRVRTELGARIRRFRRPFGVEGEITPRDRFWAALAGLGQPVSRAQLDAAFSDDFPPFVEDDAA